MNQVIDRIDENAFPLGQARGGKTAPSAAKTGTRKALGNLTNSKQQPGASTAGKQRRAFGELRSSTNNDCKAPSTSQAPSVAAAAVDRSQQLAEQYAAGGVEQLAGKGWQQLEMERHQRERAEIEASVQRMTAGLSSWGVMQVASSSDDEAELVAEPVAPLPASPSGEDVADPAGDTALDELFALPTGDLAAMLPDAGSSPMAAYPW